jgi:hypothetical protein
MNFAGLSCQYHLHDSLITKLDLTVRSHVMKFIKHYSTCLSSLSKQLSTLLPHTSEPHAFKPHTQPHASQPHPPVLFPQMKSQFFTQPTKIQNQLMTSQGRGPHSLMDPTKESSKPRRRRSRLLLNLIKGRKLNTSPVESPSQSQVKRDEKTPFRPKSAGFTNSMMAFQDESSSQSQFPTRREDAVPSQADTPSPPRARGKVNTLL